MEKKTRLPIGTVYELARSPLGVSVVVVLLLFLVFLQAFLSMRHKSPVFDETIHLSAGYYYLKTGDFRLSHDHPPLVKIMAGVPLMLLERVEPINVPRWRGEEAQKYGEKFFYASGNDADRVILLGRTSIVLLSVLLGFFVFKWAGELYGLGAGIFALFLYVLEPNILAHSRLVTTDLGSTCFIFISTYFFWRFLKEFRRKDLILTGVTFGLALASKFSALLLVPIFLSLIFLSTRTAKGKAPTENMVLSVASVFALGFLVVFLSYGCQFGYISQASSYGWICGLAGRIPLPALEWFKGFYDTFLNVQGHPAYLMGMYSNRGWWYYHFFAFLIKTPISLLVLLLLSVAFFKGIRSSDMLDEWFLMMPVAWFLLVTLFTSIDIGLRHILPIYPFLFVFVSKIVRVKFTRQTLWVGAIFLLSTWYLISSLSIYPHYLAYFNEFVGGPNSGYKYLVDSNLDWGQDLKGLAKYGREKGIEKIKLSYFGTANSNYYHIPYRKITEKEAHQYTPGIYAISATNLQNVYEEDKTRFAWLKKHEPIDKIGYSIFIYKVD